MTPDQFRSVLRAAPFVPSRIHLVDQRTFDVPHCDFAWMVPSGRTVFVASVAHEGAENIDVALIVLLSPIDGSAARAA